jgi:hypothetical protein
VSYSGVVYLDECSAFSSRRGEDLPVLVVPTTSSGTTSTLALTLSFTDHDFTIVFQLEEGIVFYLKVLSILIVSLRAGI